MVSICGLITSLVVSDYYLASSEDTAAFAKIYQSGLADDEIIETRPLDLEREFRTSQDSEDEDEDVVMSDGQEYERGDRDEGSEAEDEDEEDVDVTKGKFVTYKEIQREVRKIKEQPQVRCSAGIDSIVIN